MGFLPGGSVFCGYRRVLRIEVRVLLYGERLGRRGCVWRFLTSFTVET